MWSSACCGRRGITSAGGSGREDRKNGGRGGGRVSIGRGSVSGALVMGRRPTSPKITSDGRERNADRNREPGARNADRNREPGARGTFPTPNASRRDRRGFPRGEDKPEPRTRRPPASRMAPSLGLRPASSLLDSILGLIDATHRDVDVLLLLSNSAFYVAYYDDEVDKVNQYQRLSLEDLEKIEIGPEPTLFGKPKFSCMRLHYRYKEASGYFHTLRAVMRNPEEDGKDTLQCIAEMLQITKQAMGLDVPIIERKLERKSSKPHEDIIGIRSHNQGSLAQGKKFLMSKFSSLNQKVKQTKSNVNIGNLRRLGNFAKPEMKVNFLKPNLKVNLWKSDSSLETMENTGVIENTVQAESDGEMSSDNDSYHSDEFLTNSKSDEDRQLANSLENVGPIDYVLPSCGIIASAPRVGRSQSISSTDVSIHVPTDFTIAAHGSEFGKGCESPLKKTPSADNLHTLTGFAKPMDIYCHRFVQDAQNKMTQLSETRFLSQQASEGGNQPTHQVSNEETQSESTEHIPSRPSQLDVCSAVTGPQFLSVETAHSAGSQKTPGSGSGMLELEPGLHVTPSPSESSSRAVSPFAKIRSSMAQVANITQAGLTQGINFAVAKVQKSPAEPAAVSEVQQSELKSMLTQCQTRIIQI